MTMGRERLEKDAIMGTAIPRAAMIISLVGVAALPIMLTGCGGRLLGINLVVVGEQTALERQVLGTYEEIGSDLAAFSSVRAVDPEGNLVEPPAMTESQSAVMRALNNRRYNRDDLDLLLRERILREGNDGFLSFQEGVDAGASSLGAEMTRQIIEEENRDRATLIDRLVLTTPGVTEDDRPEVAWIFATLNQQAAPAGSHIQQRDGEWRVK